jgi:hypothetical protein
MERLGGCLCVGCLEARLGRELTPADFTEHEVNRRGAGTEHSERLASRLASVS